MNKYFSTEKVLRALGSIIMAFFLWMMATINDDPQRTMKINNLSIHYMNIEENLVFDEGEENVNIKLFGSTSAIGKVSEVNIVAVADLSGITKSGEYTIEVQILGLPDGVNLSEISTKYTLVKLGKLTEITLPVEVTTSGNAASGYALTSFDYEKQNIVITGSDNYTSRITSVKGAYSINQLKKDFSGEVTLNAYDNEGEIVENIKIAPDKLSVSGKIGLTKSVPINIVTTGECMEGYFISEITLNKDEVTLVGEASLINSLASVEIKPVNLNGISKSCDIPVTINTPEGVSVYGSTSFTAHLNVSEASVHTVTLENVEVRNIPAGFKAQLSHEPHINLTLIGDANIEEPLESGDVTAYVDASQIREEGSQKLALHFIIPEGYEVSHFEPQYVTIDFTSEASL